MHVSNEAEGSYGIDLGNTLLEPLKTGHEMLHMNIYVGQLMLLVDIEGFELNLNVPWARSEQAESR